MKAVDVYAGYQRDIDILQGVSVEARPAMLTTIIGANGVGKSTLLKCIIGTLRPHRGQILYGDKDLTKVATHDLVRLGIAYVAQRHMVFPQLSVLENLEMGTWGFRKDRKRRQEAIARVFDRAPRLRELRHRPAGVLSGGQQRLLDIERALMPDPALLLIDEPTAGLDPITAHAIYDHLRGLVAREGRTVLMVDQNVIAGTDIADYIYVLELGRNRLECTKQEFDARYRETISDWLI